MTDIQVDEDKIRRGMDEVEKLRALAQEAVSHAKEAKDAAAYYRGQKEMLEGQRRLDDERHQHDLQRIAELEGVLTGLLETFALAEAKVKQRRVSTNPTEAELEKGIRDLAADIRRDTIPIIPRDRMSKQS